MDVTSEIHAIAEKYLKKVRRSGSENVMAICPFHRKSDGSEEQHPSFAMNVYNGVYYCHACHTSGNLHTFFRDLGVPRDVVSMHYGIVIEEAKKNAPPLPDPANPGVYDIIPIDESFMGLLDYCPTKLVEDGFSKETLRAFEVGWDKWHNRMTFPIRDIKGNLVGISGRNLSGEWPKYKIYDTEYSAWDLPKRDKFDKAHVLYNAHRVIPYMMQSSTPNEETIVVVEGFKACMWVHQHCTKNVVALMGAYLSYQQRYLLNKTGAKVVMFLDNNEAGLIGTSKASERLMESMEVRVVEYPERLQEHDGAQPDDLTAQELREQLSTPPTYLTWLNNPIGYPDNRPSA